jgi:hypothetical protein
VTSLLGKFQVGGGAALLAFMAACSDASSVLFTGPDRLATWECSARAEGDSVQVVVFGLWADPAGSSGDRVQLHQWVEFRGAYIPFVIPFRVETNSLGTQVRVQMATTVNSDSPPDWGSRLWAIAETIPNNLLPRTVQLRPLGSGVTAWVRTSAWDGTRRVSDYSAPVGFAVPPRPDFDVLLGGSQSPPVARARVSGGRLSWSESYSIQGHQTSWSASARIQGEGLTRLVDGRWELRGTSLGDLAGTFSCP